MSPCLLWCFCNNLVELILVELSYHFRISVRDRCATWVAVRVSPTLRRGLPTFGLGCGYGEQQPGRRDGTALPGAIDRGTALTGPPAAGGTGRKRLDATARRETILAAAIPAFAEAGYDQTRIADIAARVGVSEPVVFQNFGTKADLFAAVLDRAAANFAHHLEAAAAEEDDVLVLLSRLMNPERLDRMHSAGNLGDLLTGGTARNEERIREGARRAVTRLADAVSKLLARGQREGSVRADVEPSALAWMVLSLVQAREFRRAHTTAPSPVLEQALLTAVLDTLRPAEPMPADGPSAGRN